MKKLSGQSFSQSLGGVSVFSVSKENRVMVKAKVRVKVRARFRVRVRVRLKLG